MNGARARGRHTDTDLARPLRVAAGHECRHLLVANLHEVRIAVRAVERADQRIDAVAGIAVDAVHAPLVFFFKQKTAYEIGHRSPLGLDYEHSSARDGYQTLHFKGA